MKKILALTCGDPNSIATLISLKAWLQLRESPYIFVFIGNKNNVDKAISYFNLSIKTKAIETSHLQDTKQISELFKEFFLVLNIDSHIDFELGKPVVTNAEYVLQSINTAVKLVEESLVSAIITNPVDKHLIDSYLQEKISAKKFLGHTEYLSDISNQKPTTMMFCSNASSLKVVPLTTHVSLKEAINSLSIDFIVDKTLQINDFLRKYYKITTPKIFMLGLNPHSGENGLMGNEEINIINPAIKKLKELDLNISGSFPADSCFSQYNINNSDIIIGMYHDQVLTPFKTLYFDSGVNTTIGLDFIRTSPDHGVGFNIAKENIASANSLIASLEVAYNLVNHE
ncbi:MAG: 4-hydroxythreonine-4-phosphate dehydrogenase PdxA [Alphaproteobacteria bacterium]|jgi:4-hydroxythreonine-4-phosphate dehydrogenase|nr:4-hydroxythreonine-4-phosphate dehydrogenase PdxA [Alphaproteobacteria bacterium]